MNDAKIYNRALLLGVSKRPFPHLLFKGGEKLQISLEDADSLIQSVATTANTDDLLFKGGEKLQISLEDVDSLIQSVATTASTDANGNVATKSSPR